MAALDPFDAPRLPPSLTRPRPRQLLGLALWVAGVCAGVWLLWRQLAAADPRVGQAWLGGLMAAAATALGTLPVLLAHTPPAERTRDAMLGFGAGVMLAACSFSLIVPGLEVAVQQGAGHWGSALIVGAGILLGGGFVFALDRWLPHEHFIKGREGKQAALLKRTWLFVFAIFLHNLPEGLAIGVAFAGNDPLAGSALATGIAIQDVPEGLVVALALRTAGYGRLTAGALGAATGLVEPLGAVLGALVLALSAVLLPWGLAFAAGAMLYVISHEIIPESHRQGHEAWATGGLMLGFVIMMLLDTALG
ncbi:ZIP family metal transporter [Eleftheria terrae]|uniref:ZIP family metal transporter n=1 Tax=Eleftheria terrae TaxID=1597781 RepID=UPI00263ADC4D|nr:ZIP family metal transporter [Eleftheria terrae]WKB53428.1 ZIP family metal transporter [Eleftheria terrae]